MRSPTAVGLIQAAAAREVGQTGILANQAAQVLRLQGEIEVKGAGELLLPVAFPQHFVQKPSWSFAGELAPNEVLEAGNYPTVSLVIKSWVIRQGLYVGAQVVIVTGGPARQVMRVHWQAEGVAITNPQPTPDDEFALEG